LTGATGASYPARPGSPATNHEPQSPQDAVPPTVVAPGAAVHGEVRGAGDLVVQGTLEGRVAVAGTVRLEAGSVVRADIRAPRVVIQDGASFQGALDTSGEAPTPTSGDGLAALRRRIRLREG